MSRTNGRRTDKSSYSNPKSKARSRKEYSKKIDNKRYRSSDKQMSKKSENNENKKVKVKMSSTYGKVCRKFPEAKVFLTANTFKRLYIEIPIRLNWRRKLTTSSVYLISNFFITNPWAMKYLEQNYDLDKYYSKLNKSFLKCCKRKHTYIVLMMFNLVVKALFNSFIKHNFNNKRYLRCNYDWTLNESISFYKYKKPGSNKSLWFVNFSVNDLYDAYASFCKNDGGKIPYSLQINHLIYNCSYNDKKINVSFKKHDHYKQMFGDEAKNYSQFAFISGNIDVVNGLLININSERKVVPKNLGVRYKLYINDKNKRKAMDKSSDSYKDDQLHKIVIKEIPLITSK